MTLQPQLFEVPAVKPSRSGGRWLSQTAARFALVERSTVLRRCAAQAARTRNRDVDDDQRDGAARFERVFTSLLLDAVDELSAEVAGFAAADGFDVTGVSVREGNGIADILVTFHGKAGKTDTACVNVKRLADDSGHTELAALAPLVKLATDPDWSDDAASAKRGYDAQRKLVEWVAGRRQILPHRDYYCLAVITSGGVVEGVRCVGVFGSVRADGRPVLSRHVSKHTAQVYVGPVRPLPDDFDVNREVANVLLPRVTAGDMMATLVAFVTTDPGERQRMAAELVDLSEDELRVKLRGLLSQQ